MGKRWLATFNAAKNQFVLVAYHATDVEMYESMLEEKVFFFFMMLGFKGSRLGSGQWGTVPPIGWRGDFQNFSIGLKLFVLWYTFMLHVYVNSCRN